MSNFIWEEFVTPSVGGGFISLYKSGERGMKMAKANTSVASNLRKIRLAKGLTQNELAEILHVKQSYISTTETGKSEPSLEYIIRFSESFGISCDYIMGMQFDASGKRIDYNLPVVSEEKIMNKKGDEARKEMTLYLTDFIFGLVSEEDSLLQSKVCDYLSWNIYRLLRVLYDAKPYRKALYKYEKDISLSLAEVGSQKALAQISGYLAKGKKGGKSLVNVTGDSFIKKEPLAYYCLTGIIDELEEKIAKELAASEK